MTSVRPRVDCWRRSLRGSPDRLLRQTPLDETSLHRTGRERQRASVGRARFDGAARAPQQVRPRRVEEVVIVQAPLSAQGIHSQQARHGSVTHGDGDGVIERHDG